jgi:glycosyltransferase involved in cell wall biosynthesis
MSSNPYFSVVIPTRNRADVVPHAVRSILRQEVDDVEVVLVDNDTTDVTAKSVYQFREDPRFKYFRTGNLGMSDNWEYGIKQAKGEYICVLSDKWIFKKDALEKLYPILKRNNPEYCSWGTNVFYETSNFFFQTIYQEKEPFWISSEDHIQKLLTSRERFADYESNGFGRYTGWGKLGAFHKDKIREIQQSPSGRLCCTMTPDCTAIFQMLQTTEQFLFVPETLVCSSFASLSNGRSFGLKLETSKQFFIDSKRQLKHCYVHVPIKFGIYAAVINDFYQMATFHGVAEKFKLDLITFFYQVWNENIFRIMHGVDMSEELDEFEKAVDEIENKEISKNIQKQIRHYLHMKPFKNPLLERFRKAKFKFYLYCYYVKRELRSLWNKERKVNYYKNYQDFFDHF